MSLTRSHGQRKLKHNDLEQWGSSCGVREGTLGIREMSEVKLRLIDQLEVELKEKEIKDDSQVPNLGCQGTWGHSLVQPISLR